MPVIVDNKHYLISADNFYIGEDDRLHFDWNVEGRSTRATKFQAKKIVRKVIMKMFKRAIENGDTIKRLREDECESEQIS